jgi:hypothetical protein
MRDCRIPSPFTRIPQINRQIQHFSQYRFKQRVSHSQNSISNPSRVFSGDGDPNIPSNESKPISSGDDSPGCSGNSDGHSGSKIVHSGESDSDLVGSGSSPEVRLRTCGVALVAGAGDGRFRVVTAGRFSRRPSFRSGWKVIPSFVIRTMWVIVRGKHSVFFAASI